MEQEKVKNKSLEVLSCLIACNVPPSTLRDEIEQKIKDSDLFKDLQICVNSVMNIDAGILDEETIVELCDGDEDYLDSIDEGDLRNSLLTLHKQLTIIFNEIYI